MTSPQGADAPMISDAFMAFRLMMSYLEDLNLSIDPASGRMRSSIENIATGLTLTTVTTVTTVTSVTNLAQIGGSPFGPANSFMPDEMDVVWGICIRQQIT